MKTTRLTPEFVEFIPEKPAHDKLYISVEYRIAVHKCCCGCGHDVVTPISPTDWKFSYDGAFVSLQPSIGNWNFPCQSHYWIRDGRIVWAPKWTSQQIAAGRADDIRRKNAFFQSRQPTESQDAAKSIDGFWSRVRRCLSR